MILPLLGNTDLYLSSKYRSFLCIILKYIIFAWICSNVIFVNTFSYIFMYTFNVWGNYFKVCTFMYNVRYMLSIFFQQNVLCWHNTCHIQKIMMFWSGILKLSIRILQSDGFGYLKLGFQVPGTRNNQHMKMIECNLIEDIFWHVWWFFEVQQCH